MTDDFLLLVAVGFAAQLVDGAVGMAYGLSATTVLLSLGVPPATASASVHTAEIFTTAASGAAHWRFGNVDRRLLWRLALPGMAGGAAGAWFLASVPGNAIRPLVSLYLLAMGIFILVKALRRGTQAPGAVNVPVLGLGGGFVDAIGGGGWGPLVASTLLGTGTKPRVAIGSVNLAEFFVTATISGTFLVTVGLELWPLIAALVLGGILAAPLAAYTTRRMPDRAMMILVAAVIIILSLRGLLQAVA
jgi:uncharacterized membrane protein YfcA